MGRQGRRKQTKRDSQELTGSFGPIAASSPQRSSGSSDINVNDTNAVKKELERRYKAIMADGNKMMNDLLSSVGDETLSQSALKWLDDYEDKENSSCTLDNKPRNKNSVCNDGDESLIGDSAGHLEFKAPKALPRRKNRDVASKSVHWDTYDKEEANRSSKALKTPAKKQGENSAGGSQVSDDSRSKFQTPCRSHNAQFAVVTPGPNMNKSVRLLRQPHAGETAVSLSGSPLIVTPFGASQVTLPMEDGKVLTMLLPRDSMTLEHDEAFPTMEASTQDKLKKIATYLLKHLDSNSE